MIFTNPYFGNLMSKCPNVKLQSIANLVEERTCVPKAKMGKYQQKPVMPKLSNPNETDAAKEKWDAVAATMVSSARAAVGQNPVGQPAGQVVSFIQLMFFRQHNPQVESGEVVDPQLGSNTGLNISNAGLNIEQALSAAFTVL